MSEATYYQRNREVILNRAKDYYENNKVLRERAKNKYRELSEKGKDIKRRYGRDRYVNMSEEDKQRLKEYQRNYRWSKHARSLFYLKELIFKIKNNNYTKDKYYFQKGKKPININEVSIDKIVLLIRCQMVNMVLKSHRIFKWWS